GPGGDHPSPSPPHDIPGSGGRETDGPGRHSGWRPTLRGRKAASGPSLAPFPATWAPAPGPGGQPQPTPGPGRPARLPPHGVGVIDGACGHRALPTPRRPAPPDLSRPAREPLLLSFNVRPSRGRP